MKYEEYIKEIQRTCPDLGTQEKNIMHMLMGLQTELGEITDIFKKNVAYGKPIDWNHVKEEFGDLHWYLGNFASFCDIIPEEEFQKNIDKLKARYPEGFTEDKALNRDLIKEYKILDREIL